MSAERLWLNWKDKKPCTDSMLSLPLVTHWLIEPIADTEKWAALKFCYTVNNDSEYWVPLNCNFESIEDAQSAVKRYLAEKRPIYLDCDGERIAA